tara:strand:- start:366 stop:962 length:597 start_codon:yes stop_codon:yes gene_type:complete
MTLIVGITGGIGSGKSTFSREVLKRKIEIFDSDKEVSLIYKKPKKQFLDYLKKIGLGRAVKNNKINKEKISRIIFSEKATKLRLEKYIFKIIRKKRSEFIRVEKRKKTKIIFCDIPLLFENNLETEFDKIVSIISSKNNRQKRLLASKKISKNQFKRIIKFQTSDIVRKSKSDMIIYNNSTVKQFIKKINKIIDALVL